MIRKYWIALLFLAAIAAVAVAHAGALTADIQQKVDDCLQNHNTDACYQANTDLDSLSWNGYGDIKMKVEKEGCDAGNRPCCHALAARLSDSNDPAQQNEGLALYRKNCASGYAISCQHLGFRLQQKGDADGARAAYGRCCAQDVSMGCKEWGELSTTPAQKDELERACARNEDGPCLALGFSRLADHQTDDAKTIFLEHCRNPASSNAPLFCDEAAKLVTLPADAQAYVDAEEACAHWGGEDAYDADRAKQIQEGIRRDCVDRSAQYEALRTKYKDAPDILFTLEQKKDEAGQ